MTVAAFDLSLTATGYARAVNQQIIEMDTLTTKLTGLMRLDHLSQAILHYCIGADIILFEDFSYGSNNPGTLERAGLAYIVRHSLFTLGQSFRLVAPTQLKKWATSKGTAKKEEMMLAVYQRWNVETKTSHEADAVALAILGVYIGGGTYGQRSLTKEQADVLDLIRNPREKKKKKVKEE